MAKNLAFRNGSVNLKVKILASPQRKTANEICEFAA